MINEYHKSKLNKKCQIFYEQMVASFERMESSVECKSLFNQDVSDTYIAVYNDHPEFFYLSHAPQMAKKMGFLGNSTTLIFNSIFSRSEILQYRMTIDKTLKNLAVLTKAALDDVAIEKIVCDYLLKNITYEINNVYNQNAATALVKNKGQCSGIAKAVKYIFDYFDIECIIVNGTASDPTAGISGPHSWNIVNIDGKYYHLDVTFMIGANMSKKQPFNYLYLNYSDSQMDINHQWDKNYYPKCNNPTLPRTSQQTHTYYSGSSTQTSKQTVQGKVVSSYVEFRREMGKVYDNRGKQFSFESKIPAKDSQDLLDTLLKEAMNEAQTRNIGFSINITVYWTQVTVDIEWK